MATESKSKDLLRRKRAEYGVWAVHNAETETQQQMIMITSKSKNPHKPGTVRGAKWLLLP